MMSTHLEESYMFLYVVEGLGEGEESTWAGEYEFSLINL